MPSTTFVDLSRFQFATTAAFHMTFPALSVGLAIFLVICYGAYCTTGNPLYLQMFRFWRKIFAVGFALGIVAGIVLTFELGLNWGTYARAVGPILGPIICLEALTAGFAIEMALQRPVSDRTWTRLFGAGSLVAALAQGVLIGGLLCGITVRHQLFAGATWDFFGHGYAVLTGLVTVLLFSLAGAARLQAKTDGALRDQMAAVVRPLTLATASGVAVSAALLPSPPVPRCTSAGWTAGSRSATRCWSRPGDSGPPTGGPAGRRTRSRSSR